MMKQTPGWEWMLAGVAVLFAVTLACSQYAPDTVAAAHTPADMVMPGSVAMAARAQDPKQGQKIFTGKGICYTCHGMEAKGTPLAPDLTDGEWLNTDGSLDGIIAIIKAGVPKPVKHPAPMPPMGGAKLSAEEVQAVAAYIRSLAPSP